MAEAEYSTTAALPIDVIWEFVQEMDNWASFLTGYQEHAKESQTESTWILKGDVGVLARVVKFRVRITEWAGPERVTFELEGLNEPMQGDGHFLMEPVTAGSDERAANEIRFEGYVLRPGRAPARRPPPGSVSRSSYHGGFGPTTERGPAVPFSPPRSRPLPCAGCRVPRRSPGSCRPSRPCPCAWS